ncbi:anti-sigma regulatory factor (Ser/Thr protein kinase) [Kribbella voronezhensis]|uniref:Anti-sigma regulatory factor (Ser/Thr protein kinase) n=1 Tax=Kribbella voronezhensis TaxID=2512212 RepID=A0A4R7TAX4_9ACTN|nr:ATP-binding protein [Kribbella voronezhensis]TDU89164.1 anti-sigma regulatory factor (Ser/Thr protein kinase) [Kribbella voronezhensis]
MGHGGPLDIAVRTVGEAIVITPSGVLEVATAPQLRTLLFKALADQPGAVIVQLQDLVLAKAYTLSLFTAVARQTADWSGIPLLLVAGQRNTRAFQVESAAVARFIPVFADLASALAAIHTPPARQLTRLRLPSDPNSCRVARRFVAATCELWRCEDLSEDAVAIVSELIGNVVRHTRSDADLRLELRRQLLTVAVSDTDPGFPVRRPPSTTRESGLGLGIVTELATAWGANATSTGGKVIWATLRLEPLNAKLAINNDWCNGR